MASADPAPVKPKNAASRAVGLWRGTKKKLMQHVEFSTSLKTLRNMCGEEDAFITSDQLVPVKVIGQGAFATVEKCEYVVADGMRCPVAVKRLKPELFEQQEDVESFAKEAELLRKIRHAYITSFLGMGQEEDRDGGNDSLYIVQEFMNCGSLKSLVLRQMGSPWKQVYSYNDAFCWLIQIAKGLAYLHDSNPQVIHRDLKMDNVLLTCPNSSRERVAKLADFGLSSLVKKPMCKGEQEDCSDKDAKRRPSFRSESDKKAALKRQSSSMSRASSTLSRAFSSMIIRGDSIKYDLTGRTGSLMYMAPEVINCEKYNEKADVFSFSIIMYELLRKSSLLVFVSTTGSPADVENYAEGIARGDRPPIPVEWPKELVQLVSECWSQDMDQRPNIKDVIPRLEALKASAALCDPSPGGACSCGGCTIQ